MCISFIRFITSVRSVRRRGEGRRGGREGGGVNERRWIRGETRGDEGRGRREREEREGGEGGLGERGEGEREHVGLPSREVLATHHATAF